MPPRRCPHCRQPLPEQASACPACGHVLSVNASAPRSPPSRPRRQQAASATTPQRPSSQQPHGRWLTLILALPALLFAVAMLCVLIDLGARAVQRIRQQPAAAGSQVLTSTDGRFQLTVPAGWQPDPELAALHPGAGLQAADRSRSLFLVGISEAQADFVGLSLERYGELNLGAQREFLADSRSTRLAAFPFDEFPAQQATIAGVFDHVRIRQLLVVLETPEHYHVLLFWTLDSQYEQYRGEFEQIARSFQPTGR